MDVTPLPHRTGAAVLAGLTDARRGLDNIRGGDTTARLTGYIKWAAVSTRQLRHLLHPKDIQRLVLTEGHRSIVTMPRTSDTITNPVLDTEVETRMVELDGVIAGLEASLSRWSGPAELVVLDTSVYIQHEKKIEDLDLTALLAIEGGPIRLLVPIAVVDELDGLKRDSRFRWRAQYSLAYLDKNLPDASLAGLLHAPESGALDTGTGGPPRHQIDGEVVLDPVGHVRLPITDDEIVDRAAAIQRIAGRPVWLVTYDTGMTMRARAAKLKVKKLRQKLGEEPPRSPQPSKREAKASPAQANPDSR